MAGLDFGDESTLRARMASTAAQMYHKGFISGVAGNLSHRLEQNRILTTPGGVGKAELAPESLVVTNLEGEVVSAPSGIKPTSEMPMHLEVYRQRPDVAAVIHAHPAACVALSLVGIDMEEPLIPEAVVLLGPVPTTEYATPSSVENREAIAGLIADHDAIILAHHGVLTVGRSLEEAYLRLETLEHVAGTIALAYQIGQPRKLTPQAVEKLVAMRKRIFG